MNAAVQQQLTNLLRANSMTPDTLDGSTLTQLFLSQMRISLYGGVASIPMFPTFLPPFGTLTENKPIAVAELDDQEIRVSLVTFSHGEAHFSDQDRFPIPRPGISCALGGPDLCHWGTDAAPSGPGTGAGPLSPLPRGL